MDEEFKAETKRLTEVAKKLKRIAVENQVVIVPVHLLRKCPRCGNVRVTLNDKCETCGLPIKSWG